MKYFYFLMVYLVSVSCLEPGQQSKKPTVNKFSDAIIREIYTAQDERKSAPLLAFLTHPQPLYRLEAVRAFASVQDSTAISPLALLLSDQEPGIRQAAAFALGQTGKQTAELSLLNALEKESTPPVKKELMEALGKCATQKGLDALTAFEWNEPILQAGQAWGIYRAHSKPLNFTKAVIKQVALLTSANPDARLAAAHFLARTPKLDLTNHFDRLLDAAQIDPTPEVRMATALALGKVKSEKLPEALAGIIQTDPDYRVRLNAIRATSASELVAVKQLLWRALTDKNSNTALAAAEVLSAKATPAEAEEVLLKAEQTLRWRIRATLLGTALKINTNKTEVLPIIQERYKTTSNFYEKGALLLAASHDISGATFIEQEIFSTKIPIIQTSGMEALVQLRSSKDFPASQKKVFMNIFKRAIATGDAGMMAIVAGAFRNPELHFKTELNDITFLKTAHAKLILPRDMETYQELKKTIDFLEGKPASPAPQNPFSHAIDWSLIQTIPVGQQAEIKTNRGSLLIELLVEEAPGTTGNFVQLARGNFYNGKPFHRVVPNFVVQGGDPRGDGWGGTDYAIRSEFANLHYREGYIGMASAGKDTESCQWFITHSPTPHLDGRYTIFARVISGMEVLHLLEVGDIMEQVIVR